MQTWNVSKRHMEPTAKWELTTDETTQVAGGIAPIVVVAIQAAAGAAANAAAAHATGGNVGTSAILGGIGGAVTGVGGLVWNTSKVLSVTLIGTGTSIIASSAYGFGSDRWSMINHY